jgi:hypothetical protein
MLLSLPSVRRLLLRPRAATAADRATLMDQISLAHERWVIADQRLSDLAGEQAEDAVRRQAELQREQASDHYQQLVAQLMHKPT